MEKLEELLEKIVNTKNLSEIKKRLKRNGFVDAQKTAGIKSASLVDIVKSDSTCLDDVYCENLIFRTTVFRNVKDYEDYEWVWLEVLKSNKKTNKKRTESFEDFTNKEEVFLPYQIILYAKKQVEA